MQQACILISYSRVLFRCFYHAQGISEVILYFQHCVDVYSDDRIIFVCIGLIGYGNSNVFSIIFSQALLSTPNKQNEVSGLMIMGLFGGTIFPMLMGVASDLLASQNGAIAVLYIGVFYLIYLWRKLS